VPFVICIKPNRVLEIVVPRSRKFRIEQKKEMERERASIIGLYNLFRKYNRFTKNPKNIRVEIVLQSSRGKRDSEALKTKGTYRF